MPGAKTQLFGRWLQGSMVVTDEGQSTGNRFFVHSGTGVDAAGYGDSPQKPVATLDYAIGLCTASKGDIIYVMPGHTETKSASGDLATFDVAGIRVVGLGVGASRPKFNFAHTGAKFTVSAAGTVIENLQLFAGVSAVVVGVDVTAADCTFRNCLWWYGGTTGWDFVIMLQLNAASHRCIVDGCRFLTEPATAGTAVGVKLTGASHNVVVKGCEFMGDFSTAALSGITTLSQGLMFLDNLAYVTTGVYLSVLTGTTGIIANTRGLAAGATVAANAVADAMVHCQNYVANTAGTIAIIKGAGGVPALDAD